MDKFKDIKEYWDKRDRKFKVTAYISIALLVALVGVFIYLYNKDSYEFLLNTSDDAVSSKVIAKLKEDNIKYSVRGTSIYVADVNPDEVKLDLSGNGVLEGSQSNIELFSSPLFISDKQEETLIQKDLEENIASAIKSYNEIDSAKVILTMGKTSSFKNDSVPAKAAIQVSLKSRLSSKQINSIQMFVASAVPNLDKMDVVITDTDNNLLSSNSDSASTEENDEYTKSIESKLSTEIADLLNIAFKGSNFKVSTRVEINFDQSKIEKETVQSGPDTIVSHETTSEITTNSTSSGTAGVESNVPSYETPEDTNETLSEKKSEVINYELNKTTEQIVKSPEIKKLSVAVIADRKLTAVETAKIQELVETAALIDEERGDKVSVQGFENTVEEAENKGNSFLTKHMDTILDKSVLIIVLILIFILALRIISLFKKDTVVVEGEQESNVEGNPIVQNSNILEEVDITKENPVLTKKKVAIQKEIEENPQQVASVFKIWQDKDK